MDAMQYIPVCKLWVAQWVQVFLPEVREWSVAQVMSISCQLELQELLWRGLAIIGIEVTQGGLYHILRQLFAKNACHVADGEGVLVPCVLSTGENLHP
jgi:hypothetical protein